ncbi:MAG TPA: hypothetical protein VF773_22940 [Verrucomicrobiae bacterium]
MTHKKAVASVGRAMKSVTWRRAQERFLSATPDERWELNVAFHKSRGLWSIEGRRKAGWGKSIEEQKNSVQAILIQKEFWKYLAAEHGFEP